MLLWRVLDVVAAPVEGGGPTLPLWGRVVTYDDGMRSGRRYAGWRGESGGGDGVCGEVDRGGDGGDGCGGGGDRKLKVASLIIL